MADFKTLEDVASVLGDGGPFAPNQTFKTVGDLVDALVDLGDDDKVHERHDDYLGLKDDLSDAFLNAPLDTDEVRFGDERERILEQANIIIPLSSRNMSKDYNEET